MRGQGLSCFSERGGDGAILPSPPEQPPRKSLIGSGGDAQLPAASVTAVILTFSQTLLLLRRMTNLVLRGVGLLALLSLGAVAPATTRV